MTTYYVNASGGNDGNTGLDTGHAFATIQAAINAAAATGDTINVAAGTYVGALDVNKSVALLGANHGTDGAAGRGAETVIVSNNATVTVTLNADNITVDGFTIINSKPAATPGIDWTAVIGNDVFEPTGSKVTNNIIHTDVPGGDAYGVNFYNNTGSSTFSEVSHNAITGGEIAVLLYNNSYASVTDNTITDTNRGVQTGNWYVAAPVGTTPEISHNDIEAHYVGIYHNLSYGTASPFTIDDNDVTGLDGAMNTPAGTGIRVISISSPGGATVTDNDVSGFTTGIQLWNDEEVTIHGGNVSGNTVGIAAIDDHPTFGQSNEPGDYGIDGVNLFGNGTDVRVQDTEFTIHDDNGTSSLSTVQLQDGATFDDNGQTGLDIGSDLIAVAGNQTMTGGDGADTLIMVNAGADGSFVDLNAGLAFSANTGVDHLVSVENVSGSAGVDGLFGDDNANVFVASAGDDVIDGRGGSDTFDASGAATAVQVDLTGGTVAGAFSAGLTSIENVKTGAGNDTITVSGAANAVDGGAGFDTVVVDADSAGQIGYAGGGVFTGAGGDTYKNVEKVDFNDNSVWLVHNAAELTAALAGAGTNDVIKLASGTYDGHFLINVDGLTIESASGDPADVIIKGDFRDDNPGMGTQNLDSWIGPQASYSGGNNNNGFSVLSNGVTIRGVTITEQLNGILIGQQANPPPGLTDTVVNNLTIDNVVLDNNVFGVHKDIATVSVDGFTFTDSTVSHSYEGMDITGADGAQFTNVLIDGVNFQHLTAKGIYAEMLSDAEISNIVMNDVAQYGRGDGFGNIGEHGVGIDVNLKYAAYDNIDIHDFTFTNVGLSNGAGSPHANAAAIAIKARNDAPNYSTDPASGTNIKIHDGTINGTSTGIRVGENGAVTNNTDVKIDNVKIDGAVVSDYDNQTTSTVKVTLDNATPADDEDHSVTTGAHTGTFDYTGTDRADSISGGAGADTIQGGDGADTIDGKGGVDTARFDSKYEDAVITGSSSSFIVNDGSTSDTLLNVEKALFMQGTALTTDDQTVWLVKSTAELTAALTGAADGDIIQLAGGTTFDGDFTINNKKLTILGADHGGGITGTPDGGESVIHGHFRILGSKDVTIDGVEMLADATSNTVGAGNAAIDLQGTGTITIQNSLFYSTFVGGNSETRGIMMSTAFDGHAIIQDNFFNGNAHTGVTGGNSWHRAIWSDGGAAQIDVFDNHIAWARSGVNFDGYDDGKINVSGNVFETSGGVNTVGSGFSIGTPVTNTYTAIHDNDMSGAGSDFNFRNIGTPASGVTFDYGATHNTSTTVDGSPTQYIEILGSITKSDSITGSDHYDIIAGDGTLPWEGGYATSGTGDDTIDGAGGNDWIVGEGGNDSLIGGTGNDTVEGNIGSDIIIGGAGNDSMDGGESASDNDVAVFDLGINNYTIAYNSGTDTYTVTEVGGGQIDTAKGFETLRFNGIDYTVAGNQNSVINSNNPVFNTPGNVVASINENSANALVTNASATDADSAATFGNIVYTLEGGSDKNSFTVDSNGVVRFAGSANFEAQSSYNFSVRATQGVTSSVKSVSVAVNDLNDNNPVITSGATGHVAENAAVSTVIYDANATDADVSFGAITYSLGGADVGLLNINASTGEVTLKASADFETNPDYSFNVIATQGSTSASKAVTVTVDDVREISPLGTVTVQVEAGSSQAPLGELDDTNGMTYRVTSLNAGGGAVFNGNAALAVNNVLTLAQLNALTFTSKADGSIVFTGSLGGEDTPLTVVLDVTPGVSKTYTGTSGANHIDGANGNDEILGKKGADDLIGGKGKDTIEGGNGNDTISGGKGHDVLDGGKGADHFVFDAALNSKHSDVILGFDQGTDKIALDGDIFVALGGSITSGEVRSNLTGDAQDKNDKLIYETDTGKLFYDADGNKAGAKVLIATLDPHISHLTSADFEIV